MKVIQLLVLLAVFAVFPCIFVAYAAELGTPGQKWFADNSPWNLEITPEEVEAGAVWMAHLRAQLDELRDAKKSVVMARDTWTTTVVYADENTPRFDLFFGKNDKWRMENVPIPPEMIPQVYRLLEKKDGDRCLCIYDVPNKLFYALYAPRLSPVEPDGMPVSTGTESDSVTVVSTGTESHRLSVSTGAIFPDEGSGWWDNRKGPWAGRASGASYCAGLVTKAELEAGEINHAIALGWPKKMMRALKMPGSSVFPAKTSDGFRLDPKTSMPMGMRLQLDPSLTEEQMRDMGLKRGDIIIAKAMQKYGGYIVESAGNFAVYFVSDFSKNAYHDTTTKWPEEILKYFRTVPLIERETVAPVEHRGLYEKTLKRIK